MIRIGFEFDDDETPLGGGAPLLRRSLVRVGRVVVFSVFCQCSAYSDVELVAVAGFHGSGSGRWGYYKARLTSN